MYSQAHQQTDAHNTLQCTSTRAPQLPGLQPLSRHCPTAPCVRPHLLQAPTHAAAAASSITTSLNRQHGPTTTDRQQTAHLDSSVRACCTVCRSVCRSRSVEHSLTLYGACWDAGVLRVLWEYVAVKCVCSTSSMCVYLGVEWCVLV